MIKNSVYRQGDVLLVKMAAAALATSLVRVTDGDVDLALGEESGHVHRFRAGSGVTAFMKEGAEDHTIAGGGTLIGGATAVAAVEVPEGGATLYHDGGERPDHDPINVEPGTYEVRRQRELTDEGDIRTVVD